MITVEQTLFGDVHVPAQGGCTKIFHERAFRYGFGTISAGTEAVKCAVASCVFHDTIACSHTGYYGSTPHTQNFLQGFRAILVMLEHQLPQYAGLLLRKGAAIRNIDLYLDHLASFRYGNFGREGDALWIRMLSDAHALDMSDTLSGEIRFLEKNVPANISETGVLENSDKIVCEQEQFDDSILRASTLCNKMFITFVREVEDIFRTCFRY